METQNGSCDSSTVVDHHNTNNHHHHQQQQMAAVGVVDEYEGCDESSELELGLGLSLGFSKINNKHFPRIFTSNNNNCLKNNDVGVGVGVGVVSPPSSASSCSSLGLRTCTKNKSCVNNDINNNSNNNNNNNDNDNNDKNSKNVCAGSKRAASPTALSQVVGWPPIRSYRMNSMANAKSTANGEHNSHFDATKGETRIFDEDKNANSKDKMPHKGSLFVKVNMDGVAIGRKVDLTAHSSYESLAQILEDMFTNNPAEESNAEELILLPKVTRPSKLLDGKSDFVLTYEDKDGDWMLVGDVPWGMFVSSVKRLKIMRTSEANGLAPRSEDRSSKHRRRPI